MVTTIKLSKHLYYVGTVLLQYEQVPRSIATRRVTQIRVSKFEGKI